MTEPAPIGHIKLARKAFDDVHGDPFWLKPREFSAFEAWVDTLQLACFAPYTHQTEFGAVALLRGEFVASLRWLGTRWKWSVKRVRNWVATCVKGGRLSVQREAGAGTVYLIVNYDTYQSQGHSKGTGGAQQGHKREAVKAVQAVKTPSAADASESNLSKFPKATCDAAHTAWTVNIGAMDYARFRKALLPLFVASPCLYDGKQLAAAVEAFSEAASAVEPRWRSSWTPLKFASEIHNWVKLGAMEIVDEWGIPTERGRALGIFAA